MKVRNGFVSNSSSASFHCVHCGNEYDIEMRGGGPESEEEWVAAGYDEMPDGGLCENCREDAWTFCNVCGKKSKQEDLIDAGHQDSVDINHICEWSEHTCFDCITKNPNKFGKWLNDWRKKISDPDYVMSDDNKKLFKAILQHDKEVINEG